MTVDQRCQLQVHRLRDAGTITHMASPPSVMEEAETTQQNKITLAYGGNRW
jgi:hypothetical protein